ncbi:MULTISPECIES: SDR family NAD(P)-dependent oxidoreductase [unclassified Blastococcus]
MSGLFDLTGRAALVTGGGSGIGLGMARALAGAGAAVTLWGRNGQRVRAAADALRGTGADAHAQQVDVSDEAAVARGMRAAADLLGGLDVVVVNAGVGLPLAPLVQASTEDYRATMATNLDGAFWTVREAARVMLERGRQGRPGGSIIAVASLAAIEGAGRNHAYGMAKAGLTGLVRSSAVELARHGIRVNAVLPGWIATDMTAAAQTSSTVTDRVISRVPAGRWGEPDDFAGVAVYLAGDASAYQTGSTVVIDGGYSVF